MQRRSSFRREWENELRSSLDAMSDNRARFWGRLLLQTIGSSPHAWNHALESFPDPDKAESWKGRAPLKKSWERKLELLASMAGADHGIVVFSQYLATQAALAESLEQKGYRAWIINGKTPAADRQPITENFRREGGVLLLTHSGTEGRNLQFCHRMVNFDLPWNPMEIEQRIGRLHRIGQKKPVEVYNIVQAGTLQAHILDILQEKLNLFELVVGETGLILGDRFSSHDFRWRGLENAGEIRRAIRAPPSPASAKNCSKPGRDTDKSRGSSTFSVVLAQYPLLRRRNLSTYFERYYRNV